MFCHFFNVVNSVNLPSIIRVAATIAITAGLSSCFLNALK